jgi:hypothetical protein
LLRHDITTCFKKPTHKGLDKYNFRRKKKLWKVDFSVEKDIAHTNRRIIFWGHNVSNGPHVKGFSHRDGALYPHTVNRSFGGGLS